MRLSHSVLGHFALSIVQRLCVPISRHGSDWNAIMSSIIKEECGIPDLCIFMITISQLLRLWEVDGDMVTSSFLGLFGNFVLELASAMDALSLHPRVRLCLSSLRDLLRTVMISE